MNTEKLHNLVNELESMMLALMAFATDGESPSEYCRMPEEQLRRLYPETLEAIQRELDRLHVANIEPFVIPHAYLDPDNVSFMALTETESEYPYLDKTIPLDLINSLNWYLRRIDLQLGSKSSHAVCEVDPNTSGVTLIVNDTPVLFAPDSKGAQFLRFLHIEQNAHECESCDAAHALYPNFEPPWSSEERKIYWLRLYQVCFGINEKVQKALKRPDIRYIDCDYLITRTLF